MVIAMELLGWIVWVARVLLPSCELGPQCGPYASGKGQGGAVVGVDFGYVMVMALGSVDAISVLADYHGVTCDHRRNHQTHRPVDHLGRQAKYEADAHA